MFHPLVYAHFAGGCFILLRLLHKGESLCCFRDSALVTYGGMLPSYPPSAPCASSFLQSLDILARKIVRLLTFATVSSCIRSLCWWMFHPLVYAHFAGGCFLLLCMLTLLVDISSSCVRSLCWWMFHPLE